MPDLTNAREEHHFYKPLIMKVMKSPKHTYILYKAALIFTSLLTGCEKEGSSGGKSIEGLLYYQDDVGQI